ncbi:C4-dicarboxylate TRAP transporter large permease protein DctM [bacterium MnTg02]|nr:C4-dicarboxylate TRAP transporter large permease protein DctM [bacterium MnTg02]
MENETLAILMGLSFFGLLFIGIPVAIALAVAGLFFGYLGFGMTLFNLLPVRIFGLMENYTLMAIPLFVFIGVMLERSKVANDMLDVIGHAMGGLRGGMGLAIILVGVLMGASTGIVGATVVTLGLLTLPVFLRRGYSKSLACGTICASGTLGQIIPPSLVLILLADILGQGLGTLFAAAMIPGLLLAAIYVVYLLIVGWVRPDMAPAIPVEERAQISKLQLLVKLIKVVVPPIGLIVAVLGSIIGGIAAPTEAASIGALGSILVAFFARRLTWQVLTETVRNTLRISAMVFFILICAQAFSLAFRGLDGDQLVLQLFELIPGGPTADIIFMLFLLFILGFFMEWIEISYIVLPLFLPILNATGADMVWISILVCLVLQTSFLTPPVGWSLFFLKGVAPPEVSSRDIYVGVMPYVLLQVVAVVLLFQYPAIATWLPKAIGW